MSKSNINQWEKGHRIKGRYEIVDIKQGGLASVYICFDHEFKDAVAIKTFQNQFLDRSEIVNRFQQEAELWMRLEKHPNIVWAKWVDRINDRPCIFMEYVKGHEEYGSDLAQWLSCGSLSIELVISFAIQICTGLIYAQRQFLKLGRPFIHRDLKPANIMITEEGIAKVTDFGLAKVFSGGDLEEHGTSEAFPKNQTPNLTNVGDVFGTPPYMAPEQWVSSKNIDSSADIFSFGCILYEMISHNPPYVGKHPSDYQDYHLRKQPAKPERENEEIPTELVSLVMKCLEKSPRQRYQTFEEVRNDLNSINYTLTGERYAYSDTGELLGVAELSNIAMALNELGSPREALNYYDRLLAQVADEVEPEMVARVFNNRANCYSSLGEKERALANYLLAKRIDQFYDFPWHNSAGIYFELGNIPKALEEVEQAIRKNANYAESHALRAKLLSQLGRHKEAIEECNTTIALEPSHHWIYAVRANCYEAIGDFDSANLDYEKQNKLGQ
jgi:serine/threonine protein kinase